MKLTSQYFVNEKIAAHLLGVSEDQIDNLYLVNLCDKYGFDKDQLTEAWQEQNRLVDLYKNEFAANHDVYGEEDADLDSDEFYDELIDYIISEETKTANQ